MISAWYATFYTKLEREAWRHGYALALHGSMSRDLDLLAVPWIKRSAKPDTLMNGFVRLLTEEGLDHVWWDKRWTPKPNGRKAACVHWLDGAHYFDVSVTPKAASATARKGR